jgi:hypothetical protein
LAGWALMAKPPGVMPSAAPMAMRLDVFVSPPDMPVPLEVQLFLNRSLFFMHNAPQAFDGEDFNHSV